MRKKAVALGLSLGLVTGGLGVSNVSAAENGQMNVNFNEKMKVPEFISGQLTSPSSKKPTNIVLNYLNNKKSLFKINHSASSTYKVIETKTDNLGFTHIRLQQMYKGKPVYGSELTAHVQKNGVLTSISGATVPDLPSQQELKKSLKYNKKEAIKIAENNLTAFLESDTPDYTKKPKAKLVIFAQDGDAHYAYLINLNFLQPKPGNWNYFIDAVSGDILHKLNDFDTGRPVTGPVDGTNSVGQGTGVLGDTKRLNTTYYNGSYWLQDNTRGEGILTYDGGNKPLIPGRLWEDSDNMLTETYDRAAVDAHYYAGVTYDFYKEEYNRNSYDGNGAAIVSTVHYGRNYNNAGWTGSQMIYGDGDGETFITFSGALDVVAHELTHAVTDYTADLIYQNESGAINESMSDIFGTLIEFHANNNPDWLIGEDIYTPGIEGDALRSMKNPAATGKPDHYSERYTGTGDNGGVHINSSIINKAAYLIAAGGTHYGVTVDGIGREKLSDIFYRTLTKYLTPDSTFSQLRSAAVQSAKDLYGTGPEVSTINAAFDAVGVE